MSWPICAAAQQLTYPGIQLKACGENFTGFSPLLIANRRFMLRLGKTYMALRVEFYGGRTTPTADVPMAHSTDGAAEECHGAPVYGHLDARAFFVLYVEGDGGGQRVECSRSARSSTTSPACGLFIRR